MTKTATATFGPVRPSGKKLDEAAGYLKSARLALLTWCRETYISSDNVTANVEDIAEMLSHAERLENLRAKLDVKVSLLGRL